MKNKTLIKTMTLFLCLYFITCLNTVTLKAYNMVCVFDPAREYDTADDNFTYSYDPDTKILDIVGTGSANDYKWKGIFNKCKKIIIGEGITEIDFSFVGLEALEEVDYPSTLVKIKDPYYMFTHHNYRLKRIVNKSSIPIPLKIQRFDEDDERQYPYWKNYIYSDFQKSLPFSPRIWKTESGEIVDECPAYSVVTATPKEYTIKYDLDGGKKGDASEWFYKYTYGTKKALPKPVKKGYTFSGWKNARLNDDVIENAFSEVMPWRTGDVGLKAIWRKIKVKKTADGIDIYISPIKKPNVTVLISTEENPQKELMKSAENPGVNVMELYCDDNGKNSRKCGDYRIISIKSDEKYKNPNLIPFKFKKGIVYYIWLKTGKVHEWERGYYNENAIYKQSAENDVYYFYKTKIKF